MMAAIDPKRSFRKMQQAREFGKNCLIKVNIITNHAVASDSVAVLFRKTCQHVHPIIERA